MNVATRTIRDFLIGLATLLVLAPPVDGQTGYGYNSLEWMVAKSEVIVVARVTDVNRESVNSRPVSGGQRITVTLEVNETLKGQPPRPLQIAYNTLYGQGRDIEALQSAGGTQLWFLVANEDRGKKAGDVILSFPGADTRFPLSPFPSNWDHLTLGPFLPEIAKLTGPTPPWFRMNLDVLESPYQILDAVRDELRAGSNTGSPAKLASIRLPIELVAWIGQRGSGLDGLTMPLDARLEALAREWIAHPEKVLAERGEGFYKREAEKELTAKWRDRLSAAATSAERAKVEDDRRRAQESVRDTLRREGIRALANFRSAENVKLLRPLLEDETTLRSTRDGIHFTEIYLTRREAYAVLKQWGVDVPEPVTEKGPAK
jgi:hypothetical protein